MSLTKNLCSMKLSRCEMDKGAQLNCRGLLPKPVFTERQRIKDNSLSQTNVTDQKTGCFSLQNKKATQPRFALNTTATFRKSPCCSVDHSPLISNVGRSAAYLLEKRKRGSSTTTKKLVALQNSTQPFANVYQPPTPSLIPYRECRKNNGLPLSNACNKIHHSLVKPSFHQQHVRARSEDAANKLKTREELLCHHASSEQSVTISNRLFSSLPRSVSQKRKMLQNKSQNAKQDCSLLKEPETHMKTLSLLERQKGVNEEQNSLVIVERSHYPCLNLNTCKGLQSQRCRNVFQKNEQSNNEKGFVLTQGPLEKPRHFSTQLPRHQQRGTKIIGKVIRTNGNQRSDSFEKTSLERESGLMGLDTLLEKKKVSPDLEEETTIKNNNCSKKSILTIDTKNPEDHDTRCLKASKGLIDLNLSITNSNANLHTADKATAAHQLLDLSLLSSAYHNDEPGDKCFVDTEQNMINKDTNDTDDKSNNLIPLLPLDAKPLNSPIFFFRDDIIKKEEDATDVTDSTITKFNSFTSTGEYNSLRNLTKSPLLSSSSLHSSTTTSLTVCDDTNASTHTCQDDNSITFHKSNDFQVDNVKNNNNQFLTTPIESSSPEITTSGMLNKDDNYIRSGSNKLLNNSEISEYISTYDTSLIFSDKNIESPHHENSYSLNKQHHISSSIPFISEGKDNCYMSDEKIQNCIINGLKGIVLKCETTKNIPLDNNNVLIPVTPLFKSKNDHTSKLNENNILSSNDHLSSDLNNTLLYSHSMTNNNTTELKQTSSFETLKEDTDLNRHPLEKHDTSNLIAISKKEDSSDFPYPWNTTVSSNEIKKENTAILSSTLEQTYGESIQQQQQQQCPEVSSLTLVQYLQYDDLPFLPKGLHTSSVKRSIVEGFSACEEDWKSHFDSLTKIQCLARYAPLFVLNELMVDVLPNIISCCSSLRSGLAKNGLLTIYALARGLSGLLDAWVYQIVTALLLRIAGCGQKFVADTALLGLNEFVKGRNVSLNVLYALCYNAREHKLTGNASYKKSLLIKECLSELLQRLRIQWETQANNNNKIKTAPSCDEMDSLPYLFQNISNANNQNIVIVSPILHEDNALFIPEHYQYDFHDVPYPRITNFFSTVTDSISNKPRIMSTNNGNNNNIQENPQIFAATLMIQLSILLDDRNALAKKTAKEIIQMLFDVFKTYSLNYRCLDTNHVLSEANNNNKTTTIKISSLTQFEEDNNSDNNNTNDHNLENNNNVLNEFIEWIQHILNTAQEPFALISKLTREVRNAVEATTKTISKSHRIKTHLFKEPLERKGGHNDQNL